MVVLCHVQSQWLSLVPALQHLVAVKDALEPWNLQEVEVEIEFLPSIKQIFDEFLTRFQKEEPMIHLLHSNCEKLLKTAMGRLMQSKAYIDKRYIVLKEIDCRNV